MKQFKWTKESSCKGQVYPKSREGHSLTFVPEPFNILVMFGGISNGRLNDIMIYDLVQKVWRNQETKGRQPAPRCYHAAFYDAQFECIFYYGGQGDKGRSLADFYILNLKTWIWKRLFLLEVPQSRHHHTVTDLNNYEREKLIFGGTCLPENQLLNDVWIFNYKDVIFNSPLPEIPGAQCQLKQTKGDIPSGRKGHSAILYKNQIFIIGGKTNDTNEINSQIYSLQLDNYIWKKIQTIGKPPSPRAFFTANMLGQDRIFIFGGIDNQSNKILNETYMLQLSDFFWSAPFTAGQMPPPRYHHSSCLLDQGDLGAIVILGGLELTFCAMDFYYLQETQVPQNLQWEQIHEPSNLEQKISQVAGSTIIEGERYLSDIEEAIIRERKKASDQKKDMEAAQKEADNIEAYCNQVMAQIQEDHRNAEKTCQDKQMIIETIFLMIKQEQIINKEISQKCKLLEEALQRINDYMVTLDQFYTSIRRNKLDENDPRESKLKKLSDQYIEEYNKSKESHKECLFQLKQTYEKLVNLSQRVETDLEQKRRDIFESNKEFEALIFDTETEEQV